MWRLASVAFVAFLSVACGSVSTNQEQTLSLAFHQGDTHKYSFHMTANEKLGFGGITFPIDVDMSADETFKVQSVDASGTADVKVDLTNISIKTTSNGVTNTTTGTPTPTIELKIAKDGRIVSMNGQAATGSFPTFSGEGSGFMTAVLPDKAVKPGDTWTKDYDQENPTGAGNVHVTTSSKYVRDETVNNIKAAVVDTTSNTDINITLDLSKLAGGSSSAIPVIPGATGLQSLTIKGTSKTVVTTWFDAAGHSIVKTHSTGNIDANITMQMTAGSTEPGMNGPITLTGMQTLDLKPA